jgi:hypothetical protein
MYPDRLRLPLGPQLTAAILEVADEIFPRCVDGNGRTSGQRKTPPARNNLTMQIGNVAWTSGAMEDRESAGYVKVHPLRHSFVAEFGGVDLREPLSVAQASALAAAIDQYAVLVFGGGWWTTHRRWRSPAVSVRCRTSAAEAFCATRN